MKRFVPNRYQLICATLLGVICSVGLVIAIDFYISKNTDHLTYNNVYSMPPNKVGLVLGTSKFVSKGKSNLYFTNRIKAAAELYRADKIQMIIVSGDNGSKYYNEPRDMKKALEKEGVPSEAIVMDFAGFRTLDSVVRAKEVFDQQHITIISQAFQNERAVYIAQEKGLEAVAFNADDVPPTWGVKTRLRECFARVKMILDLYVLDMEPKYLGDKIYLGKL